MYLFARVGFGAVLLLNMVMEVFDGVTPLEACLHIKRLLGCLRESL